MDAKAQQPACPPRSRASLRPAAARARRRVMPREFFSSTPRPPEPTPFLAVGEEFIGTQTREFRTRPPRTVYLYPTIHAVNLKHAIVDGCILTRDVARRRAPVETFFRGEIIDNIHHFFRSDAWGATFDNDVEHWGRMPAFAPYKEPFLHAMADYVDLSTSRFVFMRWKEIYIVGPGDGVSIYGFYYICLDKVLGTVTGSYLDPRHRRRSWNVLMMPHSPAKEEAVVESEDDEESVSSSDGE